MKNVQALPTVVLALSFLSFAAACTEAKQNSQQGTANSTMTDARPDLSNQPSPVDAANNASIQPNQNANPADEQRAVTTNPNSSRNTTDSTINTSAGAAVIGNANYNPRTSKDGTATPTSVDTTPGAEPMSDAAIDNANCRDAIANDYNGQTAGKTNTCPPTAQARMKSSKTQGQISRW